MLYFKFSDLFKNAKLVKNLLKFLIYYNYFLSFQINSLKIEIEIIFFFLIINNFNYLITVSFEVVKP